MTLIFYDAPDCSVILFSLVLYSHSNYTLPSSGDLQFFLYEQNQLGFAVAFMYFEFEFSLIHVALNWSQLWQNKVLRSIHLKLLTPAESV